MANEVAMVGTINVDTKEDFTKSTLTVGTEQVNAVVGASDVAIIIGASVPKESQIVNGILQKLAEALGEADYA